jgi:hypothetical protein
MEGYAHPATVIEENESVNTSKDSRAARRANAKLSHAKCGA